MVNILLLVILLLRYIREDFHVSYKAQGLYLESISTRLNECSSMHRCCRRFDWNSICVGLTLSNKASMFGASICPVETFSCLNIF